MNSAIIRKTIPLVCVAIAALCLTASESLADKQSVVVKVVDGSTNRLLPGSSARIVQNGQSISSATSTSGRFRFQLEPGSYVLVASKSGYKTAEKQIKVGSSGFGVSITLQRRRR